MFREEFKKIFLNLQACYPRTTYAEPHMLRIWNYVCPLSKDEFESAIEQLIDENQYAPSVATIKQACKPFVMARRNADRARKLEILGEAGGCLLCNGTGMVSADRDDARGREQPFAFRCMDCEAFETIGLSKAHFPPWNQDAELKFSIAGSRDSLNHDFSNSERTKIKTLISTARRQNAAQEAI